LQEAIKEIIENLLESPDVNKKDLNRIKFQISRKFNLKSIPSNSMILKNLSSDEREKLIHVLRRKIIRTISGVNVIAVMTQPLECPHGRCVYCPGGPEENSPQSYTGHEPAALRGIQNEYDPYRQVKSRIKQLEAIGHDVDKIELIIMGGTFPASSQEYQKWFVKGCLDAIHGIKSNSFIESKVLSESAVMNNVGITVETRPDYLGKEDINQILDLGVTRVEVGVQNVFDDIYKLVNRGHTINQVVSGTTNLKDSALKVCYHMMPGLPGSSPFKDLEGFKLIFTDPRFKPDMLKIYPTLVVKGTELYEWWKRGDYEPLTTEKAVELISEVKRMVPPWLRIMRVQRDIPLHQIEAGVDKGNLRQILKERLKEKGDKCNCIRCKEVGHRTLEDVCADEIQLINRVYQASGGIEVFISAEDVKNEILIGFLRLRIPSGYSFRPEISKNTALIRELHVYGEMLPVGKRRKDTWQHRGWGKALLAEAEKVSFEEFDKKHILVMSALGTKRYYAKLGYVKDGIYVSKKLS
jgi:elongator complex protein 3